MSESKRRTVLLSDAPADADGFRTESSEGPSSRVAAAIASVILGGESGGRILGLEGAWGSGKSTVIRLLCESLKNSESVRTLVFDAWAHEGDPLRRTFFESLLNDLSNGPRWLPESRDVYWNKVRLSLAKRFRKETTTTIPKPTRLGAFVGLLTLLVPLGLVVFREAYRAGWTIDPGAEFNLPFCTGLALSCGPILAVLFYALGLWIARRGSVSLADFNFLSGDSITEVDRVTIQTPEPTSIEFEEYFEELLKDSLTKVPERKLVIVIDNLDRVDANDAQTIWAALQPFIGIPHSELSSAQRQVTFIIPYDRSGLKKLWSANGDDEVVDSFIEKTFALRFSVPPPVLSDWRKFASDQLATAFPDHSDAQRTEVIRVLDSVRQSAKVEFSPRQLKVAINQVGVIHRQWGEEYTLHGAMAYVLATQTGPIVDGLLENKYPADPLRRVFGEDLKADFAGLAFNVTADHGLQLLLAQSIEDVLSSGNVEGTTELEAKHSVGFWSVVEAVVLPKLMEQPITTVLNVIVVAESADWVPLEDLNENRESLKTNLLQAVAKSTSLEAFDQNTPMGLTAWLRLGPDWKRVETIWRLLKQSVKNAGQRKDERSFDAELKSIAAFLEQAEKLNLDISQLSPLSMQVDAERWIDVCEILNNLTRRPFFKLLRPHRDIGVDQISEVIREAIDSDTLGEKHRACLNVSSEMEDTSWTAVCSSLKALIRNTSKQPAEIREGIETLRLLSTHPNPMTRSDADTVLEEVTNSGEILHWLSSFGRNAATADFILVQLLRFNRDADVATDLGNGAAGKNIATQMFNDSSEESGSRFAGNVQRWRSFDVLLDECDAAATPLPLVSAALTQACAGELRVSVVTASSIAKRADGLRKALGQEAWFEVIVALQSAENLCGNLMNLGYQSENDGLYADIIDSSTATSEFKLWLVAEYEAFDEPMWDRVFSQSEVSRRLFVLAGERLSDWKLGPVFEDAIVRLAGEVAKGNSSGTAYVRIAPLSKMVASPDTRFQLQKRILVIACQENADDCPPPEFFTLFGAEMVENGVLDSYENVVDDLYLPIVRNGDDTAVKWLRQAVERQPDILALERRGVSSFVERIREMGDKSEDMQAISSIVDQKLPSANGGVEESDPS
ncbi:P-loop NTPase fold protein [Fuerstiella marisgermanici]|uniref:Putative P-loop ATPase n=1 Tax=Fuerstiella marisgermanici TaxID=1891926 RepID=A0A1P8WKG2_9PLAN|nr:P-loop NTPase fold protein [Fuerstiella marisgermanici]APZ94540.1 putative P-loop ATPase [Fuerstiella marisgermanici]